MADPIPSLSISTEKICFVVMKAREFDVKDADTSFGDDGYDPVDDRMIEVLEDRPDDPVEQELVAFIEAMSEDEQVELSYGSRAVWKRLSSPKNYRGWAWSTST